MDSFFFFNASKSKSVLALIVLAGLLLLCVSHAATFKVLYSNNTLKSKGDSAAKLSKPAIYAIANILQMLFK